MDNTLTVRVLESVCDLADDPDAFIDRNDFPAREAGAERFAFDERHRVVKEVARITRGEKRDDVRMPKLRG